MQPGYGPPPGYPPPPYPNGQPSYSYGPQYGAPPTPPQYAPPAAAVEVPNFIAPPPPGATLAPKIYFLAGCLVAFKPVRFTKAGTEDNLQGFGKDAPKDRVTVDVYLLETPGGQPIAFGGEHDNADRLIKPNTHMVVGPARFMGVWFNATNIVRACAPGGQVRTDGMLLGRIRRSEVGQRPWNIDDVTGTPDFDRGIQIWTRANAVPAGAGWQEPQMLSAPTQAPAVNYGPPPAQYPPQPTAWMGQHPPQAAAPPGYGAPAQQIAQWTGQPAAAAAPAIPPPPPGWDPNAWATQLTDANRAEILASMAQAAPPPQAAYAPNANPWAGQ